MEKQIPAGVKVLGSLYFMAGILGIICAIAYMVVPFIYSQPVGIFLIMSLGFIVLSTLVIFMGRGLFKGQKWAVRFAIAFSLVAVLQGIGTLYFGTFNYIIKISFILNLFIICYLLLNKSARNAFSN